jgi:hypothetical protein
MCCCVSIFVTTVVLDLVFMKCKTTRHKEGVDEDGVVVTTLVTPIGNYQGADHVQSVPCSLETTGGWKMDHRLYVFSVL